MQRYGVGQHGRYKAACDTEHCVLTGSARASRIEGAIFSALDLVLGPGQAGAKVGAYSVDMLFAEAEVFDPPRPILIEYDGAYFHRDREEQDWLKAYRLREATDGIVMRLREAPLPVSEPGFGVRLPRNASAATCATLALLHLVHLLGDWNKPEIPMRVALAAARKLDASLIECRGCRVTQAWLHEVLMPSLGPASLYLPSLWVQHRAVRRARRRAAGAAGELDQASSLA